MKYIWWGIGLVVLMLFLVWRQWPDRNMHIIACDVGQGDGLLIVEGFNQVVVDGGPGESDMVSCLGRHMPFWDRSVEMVVMTHPDKDHYGGLGKVLGQYEVGVVLTSHVEEWVSKMHEEVDKRNDNMRVIRVEAGDRVGIGGMMWEVLWPVNLRDSSIRIEGKEYDWQSLASADMVELGDELEASEADVNRESVVMVLRKGEFSVLFTGDIDEEVEHELVRAKSGLPDMSVLKVAHHGSKTGSGERLLELVKPELAIISVGEGNSYGHPTEEVLSRLSGVGARVLRTDVMGEVEVVTDGERFWVSE